MNSRLEKLEKMPSGGFTLTFQGGAKVEADAVVGADGVKSTIRRLLLGDNHPDAYPKYSGEFGKIRMIYSSGND